MIFQQLRFLKKKQTPKQIKTKKKKQRETLGHLQGRWLEM